MNEGTMIYRGKEYISGTQLAAEYNIERMRDGDDKFEQMTPYQRRRKTPSFSYGDISRVLRSPRRAEGGQYFC